MKSDDEPAPRHGRRDFVVAVGSMAAAAGLPGEPAQAQAPAQGGSRDPAAAPDENEDPTRERRRTGPARPAGPTPPDEATRLFLGPLTPGTTFAGFTVIAVHAPYRGALPLALEGHGHTVQLDVLVSGAGPAPLAEGSGLAIYGSYPSTIAARRMGEAAAAVLALVGDRGDTAPALGLLTFEGREQRHEYEAYSVLRD